MNPTDQANSRRHFLATGGGAALIALTSAGGLRPAAASPAGGPGLPVAASALDPKAVVADYLKQWMFDSIRPKHALLPKSSFGGPSSRNYNLKNQRTRRFLQWEHQTFGINLGWTDNASPETARGVSRWFLARKTADQTPLRYGELLALGNGGSPSFLRYANRTVGINLDWSNTPVFEWKILGGPIGRRVSSGQWVAIYNKKAGDCLIHFDRTVGGDIGWPSSQTWTDQLGDILTGLVKEHWKEAVAYLLTLAV
jgi:hypothetical protein